MSYFPTYAETIAYTPGRPYDVTNSESDSVKMLSSVAKEAGIWLVGGELSVLLSYCWPCVVII